MAEKILPPKNTLPTTHSNVTEFQIPTKNDAQLTKETNKIIRIEKNNMLWET